MPRLQQRDTVAFEILRVPSVRLPVHLDDKQLVLATVPDQKPGNGCDYQDLHQHVPDAVHSFRGRRQRIDGWHE